MRITKDFLKKIIKEEIENLNAEQEELGNYTVKAKPQNGSIESYGTYSTYEDAEKKAKKLMEPNSELRHGFGAWQKSVLSFSYPDFAPLKKGDHLRGQWIYVDNRDIRYNLWIEGPGMPPPPSKPSV